MIHYKAEFQLEEITVKNCKHYISCGEYFNILLFVIDTHNSIIRLGTSQYFPLANPQIIRILFNNLTLYRDDAVHF